MDAARRRRAPVLTAVAASVVAVDQLTKSWALSALADGPVHVVWTLRMNLGFNRGAAFGIGQGLGPVLLVVGVALVLVLFRFSRSLTGIVPTVALGLVLGGATGNLADRLLRDHGGAVVDFIDFQWWPIFNVADMAIVVGAALLALSDGRPETEAAGTEAAAG
jgi:signal peptidase II